MTKSKSRTTPLSPVLPMLAALQDPKRAGLAGAGLILVLAAVLIVKASAPAPISDCEFLLLLKREALRCGEKVLAYEGAETRLQCAARRALRVTDTRNLDPPPRAETLIALFVALDAQVHAGVITPAAATRRLETFVGLKGCLAGAEETPR
ncbi:MAG: hypothetical protein EBS23_00620 [Betaproteobacteria bacterium]|nr:hypothetical protein [Betaproteobacteria bacterium]